MAKLALPDITPGALLGTRAGLLWRVALRAARKGEWTGWADYVSEELANSPDGSNEQSQSESKSIVELFEGQTTDPSAVELETRELCRGLGMYLEALPPKERVRSAGRLATALSLLQANTNLSPFKHLTEIKDEDQASIWQAVLSHIVTRDRAKISLDPWLDYVQQLPEALIAPWTTQMADLELSETTTARLTAALSDDEVAPEPPPAPVVLSEAPYESEPLPKEHAKAEPEAVAPPPLPPTLPPSPDVVVSKDATPDSTSDGLVALSKVVTHDLERTEEISLTDDSGTMGTDRAVPVKVFNERVTATSNERTNTTVPRSHELSGAYGARPLPAPLRAIATVTGIMLIAATVKLVLRFIFGLRKTARLWLDQDTVVLETHTHLFGKEMKRARRSFGPEGLLSVVREVRYPQIYLFIGLFALCFGALTGTIAFLDGQLAGFETWIQTGLILIVSGLVVDFVFSVLFATRPGRTSLTLTFNPRATLRVLGVKEADADAFLSELVKRSHAS